MQDNKQPAGPTTTNDSLKADIVSDIPVAAPQSGPKPASEDDELDKIMQDVSMDIKDSKSKPRKHGLFHRSKKAPKADAKFSAKPIDNVQPVPKAPPPEKPSEPIRPTTTVSPSPNQAPQAKPAKPVKPPKTSRAPVGAIVLALLVTGALSAAAVYAYK